MVLGCGLTLALFVPSGNAEAFATLHAFKGGADGANPEGALSTDSAGNLYGTTAAGGNRSCNGQGCGTLFELKPDGTEVLWEAFFTDGDAPKAGVYQDASGNLFCTTSGGGNNNAGAVFTIAPSGNEKLLYTFSGGAGDGGTPLSDLIADPSGNLYGTTSAGAEEAGTIFKLAPDGTETTLHNFFNGDGFQPLAGLTADAAENLYGTAYGGGAQGVGTIFKLTSGGTYSVLYSFGTEAGDGINPVGGVVRDKTGNLYGTTKFGGSSGCGGSGCGVVYVLPSTGKEKLLHVFQGGADGGLPLAALVRDKKGNLYGTTFSGGGTGCGGAGCGTVFKIAVDGTETLLHTFTGGKDGSQPAAALIAVNGVLYGTASKGGKHGFGTVFKLNE